MTECCGAALAAGLASKLDAASPDNLAALSIAQASALLKRKRVSPVELTKACLARIEQGQQKFNAFITVTADLALQQARTAEAEIQAGRWKGPLHGVPIAVKDNIDTAGIRTTAASGRFLDRVPARDAEVVRRLLDAGAILVGKTNLHEFAYGGSSAISAFGAVRNSVDPTRSPGGSSGGSAVAVASGMCLAALGTDTGGSIRQPAAYCGVVGFKPTYGLVSNAGVFPLAWSFDHVGPLTRRVVDAALLLNVLAGFDGDDPTSIAILPRPAGKGKTLRLGVVREFFCDGLDSEIRALFEHALRTFAQDGARIEETTLLPPGTTYAHIQQVYRAVFLAESYSLHYETLSKTPDAYQPATRKRILDGAGVSAGEYAQALREVTLLRRRVSEAVARFDALLTPTVAVPPYPIEELQDMERGRPKELEMLRNTRLLNLFGLPTLSVPCGRTQMGLPVGLQISGALATDANVLRVGQRWESIAGQGS